LPPLEAPACVERPCRASPKTQRNLAGHQPENIRWMRNQAWSADPLKVACTSAAASASENLGEEPKWTIEAAFFRCNDTDKAPATQLKQGFPIAERDGVRARRGEPTWSPHTVDRVLWTKPASPRQLHAVASSATNSLLWLSPRNVFVLGATPPQRIPSPATCPIHRAADHLSKYRFN
jgi:hypothetical protein